MHRAILQLRSPRIHQLLRIAGALPFAEWAVLQTVRDPQTLFHALAAMLVITAVTRAFAAGASREQPIVATAMGGAQRH